MLFYLALFTLLFTASVVYVLSKKIKIPFTILLVLVGLLLVPLSQIPPFGFIREFQLTPELLFYIILPVLIFESAYHINGEKLAQSIKSILSLSVVGLLISLAVIGVLGHFAFAALGFEIPLVVWLLFGALISATDPVAVLALFKELGAPRKLALIMEGESLFNDGTGLAAFLVVLAIVQSGVVEAQSFIQGMLMFISMIAGGSLFGIFMGTVFSKILQFAKDEENLQIMLTLVMAHLTFILADVISHINIAGTHIPLSPIIATTVASIMVGNYGRYKISPKIESYLTRFWGSFAFLANAIVFLLMGLIFAKLPFQLQILSPLLFVLSYVIVMIARAISVYPLIALFNVFKVEARMPLSWQHLLVWGSLRGALALIMALLVPEDLTHPLWQFPFSIREFILALTISNIYFSLFINATTIDWLLKKLNLHELKPIEKVEYAEARQMVYAKVLLKLSQFHERGYIPAPVYADFKKKYTNLYHEAKEHCHALSDQSRNVFEVVLRLYAIGVERETAQNLFAYGEISDLVYKRINDRLNIITDRLEGADNAGVSMEHINQKGIIETVASTTRRFVSLGKTDHDIKNKYMYYRALVIMARKAQKEFSSSLIKEVALIFDNEKALETMMSLYGEFETKAGLKKEAVYKDHTALLSSLSEQFAAHGVDKVEEEVLEALLKKEIITPKVFIQLQAELKSDMRT